MNIHYSFLQDELAVLEIRKHQWLESEKLGTEIGFASAAVDWVKKHGDAFKVSRLSKCALKDTLSEKRSFRRFNYHCPIQLTTQYGRIASFSNNINLIGLACTIPHPIEEKTEVTVKINFPTNQKESKFEFKSFVTRVNRSLQSSDLCYEIFIPFSEEIRDYLRGNIHSFSAALN